MQWAVTTQLQNTAYLRGLQGVNLELPRPSSFELPEQNIRPQANLGLIFRLEAAKQRIVTFARYLGTAATANKIMNAGIYGILGMNLFGSYLK